MAPPTSSSPNAAAGVAVSYGEHPNLGGILVWGGFVPDSGTTPAQIGNRRVAGREYNRGEEVVVMEPRRILVVANQTACGAELLDTVKARKDAGPVPLHVARAGNAAARARDLVTAG